MQQYIWGRLLVSVFNVLALSFPLFYLSGLHTEAKVHFQFSSVPPEMGSFFAAKCTIGGKASSSRNRIFRWDYAVYPQNPHWLSVSNYFFFLVLPVLQTTERKYHCSCSTVLIRNCLNHKENNLLPWLFATGALHLGAATSFKIGFRLLLSWPIGQPHTGAKTNFLSKIPMNLMLEKCEFCEKRGLSNMIFWKC